MVTVAVSGGFDPVHIGHIMMFDEARKLGDRLVVILNNDNWLQRKKGYAFMPEAERKAILEYLRPVDEVMLSVHDTNPVDMSVCKELRSLKPDIFANGGDRKSENTPEYEVCQELGIRMVFNVGGEKIQSSSNLVSNAQMRCARSKPINTSTKIAGVGDTDARPHHGCIQARTRHHRPQQRAGGASGEEN